YPCPSCGETLMEEGYGEEHWLVCACGYEEGIEPDPGDDPDRKYDEERGRRMLGIDVPDGVSE
ncbi:hypothetical protein LCGC14_0448530, partial [marine sediment metagenome]